MTSLVYSEKLGRKVRMDPPERQGIPTQDLIEQAVVVENWELAVELLDYMRQESDLLNKTVLGGWLDSLLDYAKTRSGVAALDLLLRVPASDLLHAYEQLAHEHHAEARRSLLECDGDSANRAVQALRLAFKTLNDVVVRWIQDVLTALADQFGEDEPAKAMRPAYDKIWRERYKTWNELTPHEQLALSSEGMRAHFGGPTRRGEFEVVDEGDRYTMFFDPCGTGGVLRRGDSESGAPPYPTTGVSTIGRPETWGKVGVHWYCVHCNLYMELFPTLDGGRPVRPLSHNIEHHQPCVWHVYKSPEYIRAEHYRAIGAVPPGDALASDGQPNSRQEPTS